MSKFATNVAFWLRRRLSIALVGFVFIVVVIFLRLFMVLTPFLFVTLLVVILVQQSFFQQVAFMLLVEKNFESVQGLKLVDCFPRSLDLQLHDPMQCMVNDHNEQLFFLDKDFILSERNISSWEIF
jgi:hypothetical protein